MARMDRWQRGFIKKLYHYDGSKRDIEGAFLLKHEHVPGRLYKYRHFRKNPDNGRIDHVDALNKGELWMSPPKFFNDPYDAAVTFESSRLPIDDFESLDDLKDAIEKLKSGEIPARRTQITGEEWAEKFKRQWREKFPDASPEQERIFDYLSKHAGDINRDICLRFCAKV